MLNLKSSCSRQKGLSKHNELDTGQQSPSFACAYAHDLQIISHNRRKPTSQPNIQGQAGSLVCVRVCCTTRHSKAFTLARFHYFPPHTRKEVVQWNCYYIK